MEPFVYDDYSDFDTEELDLEPPRRRLNTRFSPRRSLRSVSPFEVNVDEDAMEKIRNRARQATSDFLDSCDAIRQKAKAKDEDALRKFDAAIKIPMSTPQKDSNSSVRRGSLGLPPIMPRANQEGSIVSDTVITDELPARRSSLKGHPFNITPKEGSASPESEKDLSGMPPRVPRQGSILRDSHRSPHLPPMAPAPPVPPNVSTTPIVMNEISALEAFARDTRPLHEKLPRGPPVRSRFVRSVTPSSRFLTSPRASPVRSGSLAPKPTTEGAPSIGSGASTPRTSFELRRPGSRLSKHDDETDIRERISARRKMRDVETRLDKILDYELPYASSFKEMRNTLRDINDKMAKHRMLMDRYSGIQMDEPSEPVAERVAAKVDELIPRVPALSGVQNPFKPRNDEITSSFDPRLIPGYSTGLCVTPNEGTQELRGRIRNLLCRTRESSRKDATNPHLRPLSASTGRRTAAVAD
ncbi:unnamed protein product [Hymenolepis diminuta]|uniref:Uncharacterized protein n=2 Tax=Hymenolepis diminuta TaxID=6216 RepID=A0A564YDZ3_HYMDI|nr:unnamed protein product [Hymenolepis diminuta]